MIEQWLPLNIAAAALSKEEKQKLKIIRRSQRLDDQGMMADQIKNDERPIENAFYAKHIHNPQNET